MAWNSLSRMGQVVLATWAVAGTAGLFVLHGHGAEQARRLDELERAVAELRQARGASESTEGRAEKHRASPGEARSSGEARRVAGLSEQELETLAMQVEALLEGARQPVSNMQGDEPSSHAPRGLKQQAALRRANELVDQVMARGRLAHEDILELRREMDPLEGTTEAEALRKRLATAINLGKLIPDNPREPLLP